MSAKPPQQHHHHQQQRCAGTKELTQLSSLALASDTTSSTSFSQNPGSCEQPSYESPGKACSQRLRSLPEEDDSDEPVAYCVVSNLQQHHQEGLESKEVSQATSSSCRSEQASGTASSLVYSNSRYQSPFQAVEAQAQRIPWAQSVSRKSPFRKAPQQQKTKKSTVSPEVDTTSSKDATSTDTKDSRQQHSLESEEVDWADVVDSWEDEPHDFYLESSALISGDYPSFQIRNSAGLPMLGKGRKALDINSTKSDVAAEHSGKRATCSEFVKFELFALVFATVFGLAIAALPSDVIHSGFRNVQFRMLLPWYIVLFCVHWIATLTMILFSAAPYLQRGESLPRMFILKVLCLTAVVAILVEDVILRAFDAFTYPFFSFGVGSSLCFISAVYVSWKQCKVFYDSDFADLHRSADTFRFVQCRTWSPLFRRRFATMLLVSLCAFTYYIVCGVFLLIFVTLAKDSVMGQLGIGLLFTAVTAAYRAFSIRAVYHWGKLGRWPMLCELVLPRCCFRTGCSCIRRSNNVSPSRNAGRGANSPEESEGVVDQRLNQGIFIFLLYWYTFMSELYVLYITPDVVNAAVYFIVLAAEVFAHLYPTFFLDI
eukprot:gb/GECG01015135.1/.p1 GENE.gb/GECG01015135.1/~~gb/GECG01015135.1/.p1  ORF type:complete len:599 (+),score=47.86 gb/GECG01015135.1/:1-1797(+)